MRKSIYTRFKKNTECFSNFLANLQTRHFSYTSFAEKGSTEKKKISLEKQSFSQKEISAADFSAVEEKNRFS